VCHALERLTGYAVPHGEAVAIGCMVEASLAVEVTGLPPRHRARLVALLGRFGLPTAWPREIPADAALLAMQSDKKVREGAGRYALPARLGRMPAGAVPLAVDPARVLRALAEAARIDTAPPGS
jgi:3-dehydroquinate synthetase